MTPVFQTIISAQGGNCMQAAIASLLDLPLDDVPHFGGMKKGTWFSEMYTFLWENGYEYQGSIRNPKDFGSWGEDKMGNIEEKSSGLDGNYFAVVYSPMFSDFRDFKTNIRPTTHAVIVDSKCNIIHDPNPNNTGRLVYPGHLWLGFNGVTEVYMIERRPDFVKINPII